MIEKAELFARLAQGHAAGITVVTPNRRLSRSLILDFDDFQINRNLPSWEAADILPWDAFVVRLWEDALYSDLGEKLPLLLTGAQEQHLWEQILAKSGLLCVPQAAADCRKAWELQHAWRIGAGPGNEDAAAFSRWSGTYEKKTAQEVDSARLPDLIAGLLPKIRKPKLLVAYAFDAIPTQAQEFFSRFEFVECKPETGNAIAMRTSFPSLQDELEHAARWARARLEEGRQRIGVVIPELKTRRKEVVRVFTRVMGGARPFNVSIGVSLNEYSIISAALTVLELSFREIPFNAASLLIRSPFLGGAESEMARRASLDAFLRKDSGPTVSLPKLVAFSGDLPLLRKHLEAVFHLSKENPESPSDWARHFSALLEAAGFPGERTPDSDEFQARAKWHEVLAEFSKLERVSQKMGFAVAFSRLVFLCKETLFQPESGGAPVQVLGIFESAGLRYDCLWVSGLTDEAWPLNARPNPFLSIALQRKAGIPEASAEASLERARRITQDWKEAAEEVVFSFPAKDKDRDLAPSPLILEVESMQLDLPEYPRHRDSIFGSRKLEEIPDVNGPSFPGSSVRGGTRVLADQSACPFRAFARHRLAAEALEQPAPGPDDMDRGSLLHALMKNLWGDLKSSNALQGDFSSSITRAAAAAVSEARLEGRFAELERRRLEKLARSTAICASGRKLTATATSGWCTPVAST